jgi:hypothetical protein
MSTRTNLIVRGLVVTLAIVVALAFLIPGETATRLIATLAFVIALGKTAYDIWDKERERSKKADESREKIRAVAKYGNWDSTGTELGVILYNESASTPVHIQSVVCHYKSADGESERQVNFVNMKYGREELSEPKHSARFRDGDSHADLHQLFVTLPEEWLWITVTSYQGEVSRVSGKEIKKVLGLPPTSQLST